MDWLLAQSNAREAKFGLQPTLLPGGAVQQNWAFDAEFTGGHVPGRHGLVLRANFQTPLPASRDKAEEFAILRAATATGVATPEPLWLCADESVIGQPFFVMRRCGGDADARALVETARDQGFGVALVERLAQELARLHSISPDEQAIDGLKYPSGSPAVALISQYRAWLELTQDTTGVLSRALDWLEDHAPDTARQCLVHRDFRSGNFLVDGGELTAILDWEFAGWGDLHEDIGWFCARCWRAGCDELEAGGLAKRDVFYRAYEAAGGGPIDTEAVGYWEIMAHVRWALIARQQGVRAARGDEPQHELLEAAAKVPGLERAIVGMIV